MAGDPRREIEDVFRREYGRILANLIRRGRDFELAEEALQDAFSAALEKWPTGGIPDNPGAWITTVAGFLLSTLGYAGLLG